MNYQKEVKDDFAADFKIAKKTSYRELQIVTGKAWLNYELKNNRGNIWGQVRRNGWLYFEKE